MMLVISLILAIIPLLGVAWIAVYGSPTTVDGLFMSLILLAMSGILGINVLIELRKAKSGPVGRPGSAAGSRNAVSGGTVRQGKVQEVTFFEANVGEPNKSIVTLSDGSSSPQTLVLEGDVRNALPVGQRVEITLRKEIGRNVLVNVSYS
jgi:hypothetical protein